MKIKALSAAVMLLAFSATSIPAAPIVIKFSHVVTNDTPKGQAADYFKKIVEERSNGAIKVEVYPHSQLYKDIDEIEALQQGKVQMLAPSLSKFAPLGIKEFELFDLPFVFDGYDKLHKITQGSIGAKLLAMLEPRGIHGLAYWDSGFKVMSANKPIRTPEDFKGLKMRIQYSKVSDGMMRSVGAIPKIIAFSELYQALDAGTVDGCDNAPSNLYTQQLHEAQKYVTLSDHAYQGYAVIVNEEFWYSLPADSRKILEDAMKDATLFANSIAKKSNDEALTAIKKSGKSQFINLTAKERAAWKKVMDKAHKENIRRIGPELIKEVYEATGYKLD